MDAPPVRVHLPAMANIGDLTSLPMLRETRFGVYLDGGDLGEILLPRKELPASWQIGEDVRVFIHTDSEDRVVATTRVPTLLPGRIGRLRAVDATGIGTFLDWGLAKDLLVPFREQKTRMVPGKHYLVMVRVDEESGRVIATTRITRHLDLGPPPWSEGDAVELTILARTPMGYKAAVENTHTGMLFANDVFQPLQAGEKLQGYVAAVRPDGKLDLTLHPPGRARVDRLEEHILMEIKARGGYWALGDSSPADEIHRELGVSKRTFKQAAGALFKKRRITLDDRGMRLV